MTEPSEADKYIKCSKCRCKYINDDEHIKRDFGYSRLEERFKTCAKCRSKNNQNGSEKIICDVCNAVIRKGDKSRHQKSIVCTPERIFKKKEEDQSDEHKKYCKVCYTNKPNSEFTLKNGIMFKTCLACLKKRNTITNKP